MLVFVGSPMQGPLARLSRRPLKGNQMSRSGPINATELMKRLAADPEFQRKEAEKAAQRSVELERLEAEQRPLVEDLRAVGCRVPSVWDLVEETTPYPEAIPVLLSHLERPYSDAIRDGIARALAVPDASIGWSTLRSEYEAAPTGRVKMGLAAALAAASTDEVTSELLRLINDPRNNDSNILLLHGLKKLRSLDAVQALTELATNPRFAEEISSWGQKLRPQ